VPLKEPFLYIRIKNGHLKFEAENMSIWAEARFNSFSVLESSERQKVIEEIGGLAIPFQLESNEGKSLLCCCVQVRFFGK
jgi:hypothetical protein